MTLTVSTAYDTAQFDDNFPAGIERHYWFRARNAALDRTLRDAVRHGWMVEEPAIVEVGCGTGVVVAGLRARGHRVIGAEIGQPPRLLAPGHIATGTAAADLPCAVRNTSDAILFLDVIEHVPDDVALLADTLAAFPRCRTVVVTVPARPELWSSHDRYYGHFRRYTRTSLRQTLRAAGLQPCRVRYMFRSLLIAAALIKASGRDRDPVMRAGTRAVHRLLEGMLTAEDRLLGALPVPGLSLIAIATRTA